MIDSTKFWEFINDIETRESKTEKLALPLQFEARRCERSKAYDKMFYYFLDGGNPT